MRGLLKVLSVIAFVGFIGLLTLLVAVYLFSLNEKNQRLEGEIAQIKRLQSQTAQVTPTPVVQQQVQKHVLTPTPTLARSLTSYTALNKSVYQCYQDSINKLSRQAQVVDIKLSVVNSCRQAETDKALWCLRDCTKETSCYDECEADYDKACGDKAKDLEKTRDKYNSMVKEYCP